MKVNSVNYIVREIEKQGAENVNVYNDISNEDILKAKDIWDYFANIDQNLLNKRVVMGEYIKIRLDLTGWLNKRSKGAVKYYQLRWFILVSAKPIVRKHEK